MNTVTYRINLYDSVTKLPITGSITITPFAPPTSTPFKETTPQTFNGVPTLTTTSPVIAITSTLNNSSNIQPNTYYQEKGRTASPYVIITDPNNFTGLNLSSIPQQDKEELRRQRSALVNPEWANYKYNSNILYYPVVDEKGNDVKNTKTGKVQWAVSNPAKFYPFDVPERQRGPEGYLISRGLDSSKVARAGYAVKFGLVKNTAEYIKLSNSKKGTDRYKKQIEVNLQMIQYFDKEQEAYKAKLEGALQPLPTQYGFRITIPGYKEQTVFETYISLNVPNSLTAQSNILGNNVIFLGDFYLERQVADSTKEVTPFLQTKAEEIQKTKPESSKERGLKKLRSLLEEKGIDLEKIIVTSIIPILTQFGISKIYEILEQEDTQEGLEEIVGRLKKLCPTQAKLQNLIAIKAKYSTQVQGFYNTLNNIQTTVVSSTQISQALNTTLTVVTAARLVGNTALALLPTTPGAAPSLINTQKDVEERLRPILASISNVLGKITSTFVFIGTILNLINKLLSLLDILIRFCAQQLGIPYQAINAITNATNPTPPSTTYKGFTFAIEQYIDPNQETEYPKRFAVAKDKYNVIQLRSQASFTPNPDILIEELKFVIDRDGLRGD